jgi:ribonuclease VapC
VTRPGFLGVLDASAVLAVIFAESGAAQVIPFLTNAAISAVNLVEVVAKLSERVSSRTLIEQEVSRLSLAVLPFDEALGFEAGLLHRRVRGHNISLADCACLVTARRFGVPAVTGDRAWVQIPTGIPVHVFR